MKVIRHVKALKDELSYLENKSIGFVPTMGSLHKGHFSLIKSAKSKSELVIASIFVNPTQFDNKTDLVNYPSNLETDFKELKNMDTDIVFCPSFKDLYADENLIELKLSGMDQVLEGKMRSGHFNGVVRVLNIFFSLISPQIAFFGEKDFQQFLVVKELANQFFPNITIISCPTLRERNGLAMSSRNMRLSINDQKVASEIFKTLNYCRDKFNFSNIKELEITCLNRLKEFSDPEYFEIRNSKTLSNEINSFEKYRAFVATTISGVRLIDNLAIN